MVESLDNPLSLRERFYEIIFEADTPAGKAFDVGLIVAMIVVILSTLPAQGNCGIR